MASKKEKKLSSAIEQLKEAIAAYKSSERKNELPFLALSKAFEIAVEYAWRELKMRVEDEGLDAQSPKAAIKQAAKLGLISSPEEWLLCIDARNNSVHDYFGITEKEYAALAEKLIDLAENYQKRG